MGAGLWPDWNKILIKFLNYHKKNILNCNIKESIVCSTQFDYNTSVLYVYLEKRVA